MKGLGFSLVQFCQCQFALSPALQGMPKMKKETKPMAYPISTLSFSYRVQVEKEKNVVYKYWGGDK